MNNIEEVDFKFGLCAVCNKKVTVKFCDYIIEYDNNPIFLRDYKGFRDINKRGAQYKTCDLPMCDGCAKEVAIDHDFCPHHYSLYLKRHLPDKKQRARSLRTRGLLMNYGEEVTE